MRESTVTNIPDKRYFRPDELAKIIEQPRRLIYRWLREDRIKHLHFGRKTRIPKEEICRILREGIRC
jgi:excisionase family DNA binding protein